MCVSNFFITGFSFPIKGSFNMTCLPTYVCFFFIHAAVGKLYSRKMRASTSFNAINGMKTPEGTEN